MRFVTLMPVEVYCDNCSSKTTMILKEGGSIFTNISNTSNSCGWFCEYDEVTPSKSKIYCPECYDKLFGRKLLLD